MCLSMVNALGPRELTFDLAGNVAKAEVNAELITEGCTTAAMGQPPRAPLNFCSRAWDEPPVCFPPSASPLPLPLRHAMGAPGKVPLIEWHLQYTHQTSTFSRQVHGPALRKDEWLAVLHEQEVSGGMDCAQGQQVHQPRVRVQ